jgi:hypothetical protein
MALITQVSTANTFNDWLNTTIQVANTLNSLTDGGNTSTFFVNTNLQIANNLSVGGNLTITGDATFDGGFGIIDVPIAGNTVINGTLSAGNTTVNNLIVTQNVTQVNVTTTLDVGENTNVYGNLTVAQNTTVANLFVTDIFASLSNVNVSNLFVTQNTDTLNVTNTLDVGDDLRVYGNLTVFGTTILTGLTAGNVSLTSNLANINIANVNTLIGQANTEIYTYIDNTLGATANANIAKAFLAYSIIFG